MLDVQTNPMINCHPGKDRAEESSEEECAQYDSGDDLTENIFVNCVEIREKKCQVEVSALFQGRTQKTQVQVSAIFPGCTLWKSVTFSS